MTASHQCHVDELRTLFLFEALTDEQLETLCAHGYIEEFQPGPIIVEGEPATCLYVLIEGELAMSKLSGGQDIETNRTSHRGVYCGAWRAFTGQLQRQSYDASVYVTKPSTSDGWRPASSMAAPTASIANRISLRPLSFENSVAPMPAMAALPASPLPFAGLTAAPA